MCVSEINYYETIDVAKLVIVCLCEAHKREKNSF